MVKQCLGTNDNKALLRSTERNVRAIEIQDEAGRCTD